MSTKYKRIGQLVIRPLMLRGGMSAWDLAKKFYDECPNLCFDEDFDYYKRNGCIIIRPHLFGMVAPIEYEGENIWYIRMVVGPLLELIMAMPCYLPKVAFCRDNNPEHMIVMDTDRAIKIAYAMNKKGK